jgi:Fe-S cluster assembly protein SufD
MRTKSVRAFDVEATQRAGAGDSVWLAARRAAALERFAATPMPSTQEEIWRYLELDFDIADFVPVDRPGTPVPAGPLEAGFSVSAIARIVDGHWVEGAAVADRVTVRSLADAAVQDEETLQRAYAEAGITATDKFAVAHDAFGGGGVLIHVPSRAIVDQPMLVDVQATVDDGASFPRVVFVVDEAAQASVVVHLRSAHGINLLTVPQFLLIAGDGARLSITVVQDWGTGTRSIGHARATAGRDAFVQFAEIGLGSRLARLHFEADLVGRGSTADVIGAYFGDRDQALDYRYFMRHIGTNTRSDMFLKGAVEDEAVSVFTGMIRIEETGQKTEAFQTNRNLLLSAGARAESVPNLEILANDVRCGHGSTMGPLDAEQRYYLMSRGLSKDRADRLQVRGFFEEVLRRIPHAAVAVPVRQWFNEKYAAAQAEGRV